MDRELRKLERRQEPLKYKLLRRRLGFGEVLPTESSPKIFNTTELLFDLKFWRLAKNISLYEKFSGCGCASGSGSMNGDGWSHQFCSMNYGGGLAGTSFNYGEGSGSGNADGYGREYGYGSCNYW